MSTCAKCGGHFFGIVEQEPSGSRFKVYFVQCTSCQSPIGVMDYFDNNSIVKALEQKVDRIESLVNDLDYKLTIIAQKIR